LHIYAIDGIGAIEDVDWLAGFGGRLKEIAEVLS